MSTSIWSETRLAPGKGGEPKESEHRTTFEQDYDRILFSSAVRRLSDKTQVFPLDANDAVRTRLTHSHEVANLARSIGLRAITTDENAFNGAEFWRVVLPILGAAGLSHDLGNPPFGHQGEAAVSEWFTQNEKWIFDRCDKTPDAAAIPPVHAEHRNDFLKFDGNPQSLRLLTKLQTSHGKVGLDLSACTIAATMKYTVAAANTDKGDPSKKKAGYFHSEKETVDWVRSETGLDDGQRHPVAWITEAADDTAYSVLDVEDSMKKGIISPDDLLTILTSDDALKPLAAVKRMVEKFEVVDHLDRSPVVRRDIKIGYARSFLIEELVVHATTEYLTRKEEIWAFNNKTALMDTNPLCDKLKDVAKQYAFGNSEVLFVEGKGRRAVYNLMDFIWEAITNRSDSEIHSSRKEAFSRYVFSLISPNYIEASQIENCTDGQASQLRYRELKLLTDMVSGMTDQFALNLSDKIQTLK